MKLSAIVFVFWPEDEFLIDTCLKSLNFADEIIVIDNGATQKTIEIIKKYTSKIYKSSSNSFAERHNFGAEKAGGDWLLFIDSDERVSQKLAQEILHISDKFSAYQLHRVNYFLGKEVRFGDRYPDYVTRLFQKNKLQTWVGDIHESSQVSGEIGKLDSPLYHLTHRDIFSMMAKTVNFSEHEAQIRLKANHPQVAWWRLVRVFLTEFWIRILKYQGWRQGTEGWIDGIFQAFSLFIVYARLWELQRKPTLGETYQEIDQKILAGQI